MIVVLKNKQFKKYNGTVLSHFFFENHIIVHFRKWKTIIIARSTKWKEGSFSTQSMVVGRK